MDAELRHVLLVDDDTAIQTIAKLSLELVGGFQVFVASSGVEALSIAREYPPQLILLDVMMPDMDGPQTLGEINRDPELKGIPVIFMTAKTQKEDISKLKALGVAGIVAKPFEPMTLADSLKQIWREAPEH